MSNLLLLLGTRICGLSYLFPTEGQAHRVTVKQFFDLYNLLLTATGYLQSSTVAPSLVSFG